MAPVLSTVTGAQFLKFWRNPLPSDVTETKSFDIIHSIVTEAQRLCRIGNALESGEELKNFGIILSIVTEALAPEAYDFLLILSIV